MKDYLLKFNPYSKRVQELELDINLLENKIVNLQDENDWAKANDPIEIFQKLKHLKDKSNLHILYMDAVETLIHYNEIMLISCKNNIDSTKNPLNYFFKHKRELQRELQKEKDLIEGEINELTKNLKAYTNSLNTNRKELQKTLNDLNRSNDIDLDRNLKYIKTLENELSPLNTELENLLKLKIKVDNELDPFIKKMFSVEKQIEEVNEDLKQATDYDNEMDRSNTYERAMIHEKCRKKFGDSSPRNVIRMKRNLLSKLERDIEKLKNRATGISKKSSRIIDLLIIDGNNMCYENNIFVGIDPLIALTSKLEEKFKIILIFDSDIRSILKNDSQNIKSKFKKYVKVHIVATKQKADETILSLASNNENAYVLSNDRFIDYIDKEVILNDRIIRHEIINNQVLIHDLDINLKWN